MFSALIVASNHITVSGTLLTVRMHPIFQQEIFIVLWFTFIDHNNVVLVLGRCMAIHPSTAIAHAILFLVGFRPSPDLN
jgi:hypothetical protein